MKAIWKFELEVTDVQVLEMPVGAQILSLQVQRGIPCVWASVNPAAGQTELRRIRMLGTGHEHSMAGEFIGTFQLSGGELVLHVFEEVS